MDLLCGRDGKNSLAKDFLDDVARSPKRIVWIKSTTQSTHRLIAQFRKRVGFSYQDYYEQRWNLTP